MLYTTKEQNLEIVRKELSKMSESQMRSMFLEERNICHYRSREFWASNCKGCPAHSTYFYSASLGIDGYTQRFKALLKTRACCFGMDEIESNRVLLDLRENPDVISQLPPKQKLLIIKIISGYEREEES